MAVQDNAKFKDWEKANTELQKRKAYFEAAKAFSKKHPLRQICKKNLEDAQAAYDKTVSELE
jgi:hypothetical protein